MFFFCLFVFAVSIAVFRISELCPTFLSHQYQLKQFESAGDASPRKLVRHSGVHVCIATTGKENASSDVFCRKIC